MASPSGVLLFPRLSSLTILLVLATSNFAVGQGTAPPLAVSYASYFGGSGSETATSVLLDPAGNIYLVGSTTSTDLPGTSNSFQPAHGVGFPKNWDVFVAKLDPTGTKLLWATYIGGDADDLATSAALDSSGNIIVAGTTDSTTFPTTMVLQVGDAPSSSQCSFTPCSFIMKVRTDGKQLMFSALLPLTIGAIAIEPSGDLFIGGTITDVLETATFVTPGALNAAALTPDGNLIGAPFLARLTPDGTQTAFVAVLGAGTGQNGSTVNALQLDGAGNCYVFGTNAAGDMLTTPGSYQATFPNAGLDLRSGALRAGFVIKVNGTGSTMLYGTYFGMRYSDTAMMDAILDSSGSLFLLGSTNATNLPTTTGSFESSNPNSSASSTNAGYVAKLGPDGVLISALSYLPETPLGGALTDDGALHLIMGKYFQLNQSNLGLRSEYAFGFSNSSIAASSSASIWLLGTSNIDTFITPNALKKVSDGNNLSIINIGPLQPAISKVQNAASFSNGPFAPGELITIFGSELGPMPSLGLQVNGQVVTSTLGGTTLSFDGVAAPMLYVGADQINTIIPFEVATNGSTHVTVQYQGVTSNSVALPLQPSASGIFTATGTGLGQGAILNQDGSSNSPANPAPRGSAISIYATGGGQTVPSAIDGMLASEASELMLPVTVGIANGGVPVLYAGDAPGLVEGVIQINARIPDDAPVGPAVPLVVRIGDAYSQTVTVAIR